MIINSGWDLIIIDEAHRVAGSTGEVARYKLGYLLSQVSPYLLLLSATPHNGKTEPCFCGRVELVIWITAGCGCDLDVVAKTGACGGNKQ